MQIGATARGQGRTQFLPVIYDELRRKQMEEMSGKLGASFVMTEYTRSVAAWRLFCLLALVHMC